MECKSLINYYNEPNDEIIAGHSVCPIENEHIDIFPSVVDRFFTRYYHIKPGRPKEVYMVLFHSNRVCLICLAPCHPILSQNLNDIKISYNIGNSDRSANKVKGKGKKGGMALQPDSTLAILTSDNVNYKVPSCIRSKLIEVNDKLPNKPELLGQEGDGYLAIVLPKPENCEDIKTSLLTQEQFDAENGNNNFK